MKKVLLALFVFVMAVPVFAQNQNNSTTTPQFKDITFFDLDFSKDGKTITFRAASRVTSGKVDYEWDFGNGVTKKGQEVEMTYDSYGIKTVTLKGTIQGTNVTSSITKEVDVDKPGTVKWNRNFLD